MKTLTCKQCGYQTHEKQEGRFYDCPICSHKTRIAYSKQEVASLCAVDKMAHNIMEMGEDRAWNAIQAIVFKQRLTYIELFLEAQLKLKEGK